MSTFIILSEWKNFVYENKEEILCREMVSHCKLRCALKCLIIALITRNLQI